MEQIPKIYATEKTPADDKIIWLHYFSAGSDHYIAELERDEDGTWIGFGWAVLAAHPDGAEWGYVSLDELEQMHLRVRGLPILVERDLHWTPRPFGVVRKELHS